MYSTLDARDASAINECIKSCLAKSNRGSMHYVARSIVEGLTRCGGGRQGAPDLPAEILSFAATSYSCWYESAILLKRMFLRDNSTTSLLTLSSIYHSLGEQDFALAIK